MKSISPRSSKRTLLLHNSGKNTNNNRILRSHVELEGVGIDLEDKVGILRYRPN